MVWQAGLHSLTSPRPHPLEETAHLRGQGGDFSDDPGRRYGPARSSITIRPGSLGANRERSDDRLSMGEDRFHHRKSGESPPGHDHLGLDWCVKVTYDFNAFWTYWWAYRNLPDAPVVLEFRASLITKLQFVRTTLEREPIAVDMTELKIIAELVDRVAANESD